MAVQIAGSAQSVTSPANTVHSVSLPAGIQASDRLLIVLGFGSNPTIGGTITTEYTQLSNLSFSTARALSYYKTATGSEGSTVAFTTPSNTRVAAIALRITGHDSGTAPEISTAANATSVSPDPNSLTPSWGAENTLWIPWFVSDDANTTTAYPETDNNIGNGVPDVGGARIGVCSLELNAASYDAGAFTIGTSKPWAAFTIAIRPSAGSLIERTVTDSLGLEDIGQAALVLDAGYELQLSDLIDVAVAYNRAPTDVLGLIDSISQDLTGGGEHAQSVTDNLGLVDTGAADLFTPADVLGLSDSVVVDYTPGAIERTVTDDLGLLDQGTAALIVQGESFDFLGLEDSGQADLYASADPLGLTDSITQELTETGVERTLTDSVGLTDSGSIDHVADRLGITDSVIAEVASASEAVITDLLGLLDSASAESQSVRDQTDDLGLTDSVSAELIGAGEALFIDPLELTDTGSGLFEGDADLLGLTDSVFYVTGGSESKTVDDNLGLTDTVTGVSDLQRDFSDALGLTDSTETVSAVTRAVTNVLGLTDDVTADLVGAADLVITDPLGLTDDVSVTASLAQTRTDNLGLVDSITVDLVGADEITIIELLGLTDNTTQVAASSRSQTDNLGLTDSIDVVLIGQLISVSITDLIGLTDNTDRAGGHQRFADDPLGLVDAVTRAIDYSRERIDLLGLTDSITLQAAGPDFWKPRPVPYTRDPVPYTKAPVAYVPVRAGDSPPWN